MLEIEAGCNDRDLEVGNSGERVREMRGSKRTTECGSPWLPKLYRCIPLSSPGRLSIPRERRGEVLPVGASEGFVG